MIADSLVRQFKTIVGDDNAWTDATDLHTYSYDAAVVDPVQPGLIVRPTSTKRWVRRCAFAMKTACRSPFGAPAPI
jgi:FAD/FMN-containing dehydrogenase